MASQHLAQWSESSDANAVEDSNGETESAGFWYGHASSSNVWHAHSPLMGVESAASTKLLGYAMDGFPIYGPLDDASSLDACNGITNSDGSYQYHVRSLEQVDQSLGYCQGTSVEVNWNYILGCYWGSVEGSAVYDSTEYSLDSSCIEDGDTTNSPTAAPITSSPMKSPTSSPVAAPTTTGTCFDSELSVVVNSKARACTWVAQKSTEKRCAKWRYTALRRAACVLPTLAKIRPKGSTSLMEIQRVATGWPPKTPRYDAPKQ